MPILCGLIFSLLLLPQSVWAQNHVVTGEVFRNSQREMFLESTTEGKIYRIHSPIGHVQEGLNRLQPGDLLEATMNPSAEGQDWEIQTIHFVGLKRLLGLWQGEDGLFYHFADFQDLLISPSDPRDKNAQETTVLAYSLAPESDHHWSILIIGNGAVASGLIRFQGRFVTLQTFDSESLEASRTVRLRRLTSDKD